MASVNARMSVLLLVALAVALGVLVRRSIDPTAVAEGDPAKTPNSTVPGGPNGTETDRPQMSPGSRRGGGSRSGRDSRPQGPGVMPDLLDPRLVPGQPGVGVPEGRGGSWRDDGGGSDPDRNRAASSHPAPALVPPEVADRPPEVPPTPQGAGRFAADFVRDGERPEQVEADPATLAAATAQIAAQRRAVQACFAGSGGPMPPLIVGADLNRSGADGPTGYAGSAQLAGGGELRDDVEQCVVQALDALVLPPPPNAWGMTVPLR